MVAGRFLGIWVARGASDGYPRTRATGGVADGYIKRVPITIGEPSVVPVAVAATGLMGMALAATRAAGGSRRVPDGSELAWLAGGLPIAIGKPSIIPVAKIGRAHV